MRDVECTKRTQRFLLLYTVLFALAAVLAFHLFPEQGRRMVWKRDGLTQHYVALRYYARWGRAVLRSILAGKPSFPTYNLHIGYGSDLFTTFQYYVIGDPFSLPAVFVPQKYLLDFHDAMIILRLYLAGICFDRFCCVMGHRKLTGNLCGALLYVFSSFTLFGMRHPYFLNALIWFPLLLVGAESILRGKKGRLFTVAVFLSCISNFYFFYMLVIMTVLYVVWRALRIHLFPCLTGRAAGSGDKREVETSDKIAVELTEKNEVETNDKKVVETGEKTAAVSGERAGNDRSQLWEAWKQIGLLAVRFFSRAVLGLCMGMVLFLPVVLRFLNDPRTEGGPVYAMLYPAEFYRGFAEAFFSFGTKKALEYWTCMGYGALGLLGVLLLFLMPGKKHRDLKVSWCCLLAMVLLPAAGAALNGFTYPSNRWIWAFCMLTAYIAAVMIPEIPALPWRRMAGLLLCLGIYAGVCRAGGASVTTMAELILAAAAVLAVRALAPTGRPGSAGVLRAGESDSAAVQQAGKQADGEAPGAGKPDYAAAGAVRVRRAVCSLVLTGTVLTSVSVHAYDCFEKGKRNSDINQYKADDYIEAMVNSDAAGVRRIVDESGGGETFYRYCGRGLANNFSVLHDVSNTQYFWSLSDGTVVQFFTETGQGNESVDIYDNLDNRTMLDEVAGVRYYKRGDGSLLPYGYRKLEGYKYDIRELFSQTGPDELPVSAFAVYENEYALPLGFSSDRVIARSDWEALSIPERQQALMQGIVLEDGEIPAPGIRQIRAQDLSFTEKELQESFQAEDGIEIRQTNDGHIQIAVLDKDARLYMDADQLGGTAGAETGILFTDMSYEELTGPDAERAGEIQAEKSADQSSGQGQTVRLPSAIETIKITVKAGRGGETVSNKDVSYALEDNPWGTGRKDFLSCCGYSEKPLEEITLKFSRRGIYTFRDLKAVCQPMEEYPAQAEALRACVLEELDLHELTGSGATSRITGRITVPEETSVLSGTAAAGEAAAAGKAAAGEEAGTAEKTAGSGKRILCLQIPRSRGMQAYVDGQKVPLLQADTMFSAIALEPGSHEIELRYRTPGLAAGALVSLIAILLFLLECAGFAGRRR